MVLLAILVAVCSGVLAYFVVVFRKRRTNPLPPFSQASMFENTRAGNVQNSLFQLERFREFFASVGENECGSIFRLRVPFWNPFIMVSDYRQAKLILTGDSKAGIKEAEKSHIMKAMNWLDRKENSLLTHLTSDEARDRARKYISQAFSTSNLNRTWPHIKGVLEEQFASLRAASKTGTIVDMRSNIVLFFMRTLSKGAFGVEFTDDGTETENSVNGLEYMQAGDIAARESALEVIMPFRPYMFWETGVRENARAVQTLRRGAEKILRLHAAQQPLSDQSSVDRQPHTVLDHIAQHAYSKEISRLSDVSIFTFAGIDTTAYTLCFLVMEMCQNPTVKSKLQAELATFMPPRGAPHAHGAASVSTAVNEKELLSAIANCEYLNWCIKEILRLWPVAGGGPGRDLVEDIEYSGMCLPKGSLIIVHFYSMFRERWIDQPDVYLPERWSDSNPHLPQLKEMLMPFSLGKRACIGQNMAMFQLRIVAAHFLHYFDFELAAEPTFAYFLTLKPDQLLMRVHNRV